MKQTHGIVEVAGQQARKLVQFFRKGPGSLAEEVELE